MTNMPMEPLLLPNIMARSLVSAHVESRKTARREELRARRAAARAGADGGKEEEEEEG
jgi:hypothetical protein